MVSYLILWPTHDEKMGFVFLELTKIFLKPIMLLSAEQIFKSKGKQS